MRDLDGGRWRNEWTADNYVSNDYGGGLAEV
jgi:hypothetical protein